MAGHCTVCARWGSAAQRTAAAKRLALESQQLDRPKGFRHVCAGLFTLAMLLIIFASTSRCDRAVYSMNQWHLRDTEGQK
jgi:hypothetical protein